MYYQQLNGGRCTMVPHWIPTHRGCSQLLCHILIDHVFMKWEKKKNQQCFPYKVNHRSDWFMIFFFPTKGHGLETRFPLFESIFGRRAKKLKPSLLLLPGKNILNITFESENQITFKTICFTVLGCSMNSRTLIPISPLIINKKLSHNSPNRVWFY